MIPFVTATETNRANMSYPEFSDSVYNLVLVANAEGHVTIPAGASRVIFNSTAAIFVKVGAAGITATVPSGNITDGTGSRLNPSGIAFKPTDTTISCISASASIVELSFYG